MTVWSETNIEIPAHHILGPSVAEHMNPTCFTIYNIPLRECRNYWLYRSVPCSELSVGSFLVPTWRPAGTECKKSQIPSVRLQQEEFAFNSLQFKQGSMIPSGI